MIIGQSTSAGTARLRPISVSVICGIAAITSAMVAAGCGRHTAADAPAATADPIAVVASPASSPMDDAPTAPDSDASDSNGNGNSDSSGNGNFGNGGGNNGNGNTITTGGGTDVVKGPATIEYDKDGNLQSVHTSG